MGVQVEPPTRDTENASREMLDHFGKILDFRKKNADRPKSCLVLLFFKVVLSIVGKSNNLLVFSRLTYMADAFQKY